MHDLLLPIPFCIYLFTPGINTGKWRNIKDKFWTAPVLIHLNWKPLQRSTAVYLTLQKIKKCIFYDIESFDVFLSLINKELTTNNIKVKHLRRNLKRSLAIHSFLFKEIFKRYTFILCWVTNWRAYPFLSVK